jgi:hypothetical protein
VDDKSPSGATVSTIADFQTVPQIYYGDSPEASPFSFGCRIYALFELVSR